MPRPKSDGNNLRHGHARFGKHSRTYRSWAHMKERCTNPTCSDYADYGGRGIAVCERWRDSFQAFLHDMGEAPKGTSIDRVNNGEGYSRENCRWATHKEQARNSRRNRIVTVRGQSGALSALVELFGVNYDLVKTRLKRGWSAENAFFKPRRVWA